MTSLIGLAAAAAGVQLLLTASGAALTAVMAAMAALWLIATIQHSVLARNATPPRNAPDDSTRHGAGSAGLR